MQVYNPYSNEFRKWHGREKGEQPPKPFHLPDKHWDRSDANSGMLTLYCRGRGRSCIEKLFSLLQPQFAFFW